MVGGIQVCNYYSVQVHQMKVLIKQKVLFWYKFNNYYVLNFRFLFFSKNNEDDRRIFNIILEM